MIIIEMPRDEQTYAEQIAEKAEMATMAVAPKSFSSELNDIIQVGIQLASYAIPAVVLILVEMIKTKKNLKIKISNDSFEAEGREEEVLALAAEYVRQKKEEEAVKTVIKLLELDAAEPKEIGDGKQQ